jgi:hypothetical protein
MSWATAAPPKKRAAAAEQAIAAVRRDFVVVNINGSYAMLGMQTRGRPRNIQQLLAMPWRRRFHCCRDTMIARCRKNETEKAKKTSDTLELYQMFVVCTLVCQKVVQAQQLYQSSLLTEGQGGVMHVARGVEAVKARQVVCNVRRPFSGQHTSARFG